MTTISHRRQLMLTYLCYQVICERNKMEMGIPEVYSHIDLTQMATVKVCYEVDYFKTKFDESAFGFMLDKRSKQS